MPPQSTTTLGAIRAQFCGSTTARGVLEALTPTVSSDRGFERSRVRNKTLRDWADGKSSIQFRKFDWLRTGAVTEPFVLLPDVIQRIEQVAVTIAYPNMPALYGTDDVDSMEDVIRADARQFRDALLSPGNLISGAIAVLPTIAEPERGEAVWFQEIRCEVQYYEAQTLT